MKWLCLYVLPFHVACSLGQLLELSGSNCDQGNVTSLSPWQLELIKDYPGGQGSVMGKLCWNTTQGLSNRHAQALWILGMKALSNFAYDLCKTVFQELNTRHKDFILGYFGLAMCNAQLIWNNENPVQSFQILQTGREVMSSFPHSVLNDREMAYYLAAEKLNNWSMEYEKCPVNKSTRLDSKEGIQATRLCRYEAFSDAVGNLSRDSDDVNAGAYSILASLAVASVNCSGNEDCRFADRAREVAVSLYNSDQGHDHPAVLHYGLHAHDFPDVKIYDAGVPFAETYPTLVNGTCHSTHMPSHIWDRAGNFTLGMKSNHISVHGADWFSIKAEALKSVGGTVGNLSWEPGTSNWVSAFGFAYNAANLYHSLEYEQYEKLQLCDFGGARQLTERMAVAAFQALSAGGGFSFESNAEFGKAWYQSTTYYQWLYRMEARHAQQILMLYLLGEFEKGGNLELISLSGLGFGLPTPLSWDGHDVYDHATYSPQSEAGWWNAVAIERAISVISKVNPAGTLEDAQFARTNFSHVACGGDVDGQLPCGDVVLAMAEKRINQAHDRYVESETWYEANLTYVLLAEIRSIGALAAGEPKEALHWSNEARKFEKQSLPLLKPTSTTLYFVPGHAFHGILILALLRLVPNELPKSHLELLTEANASFAECLAPTGRPNLALCLLGAARVSDALHSSQHAVVLYEKLMLSWASAQSPVPESSMCRGIREMSCAYIITNGTDHNPVLKTFCEQGNSGQQKRRLRDEERFTERQSGLSETVAQLKFLLMMTITCAGVFFVAALMFFCLWARTVRANYEHANDAHDFI